MKLYYLAWFHVFGSSLLSSACGDAAHVRRVDSGDPTPQLTPTVKNDTAQDAQNECPGYKIDSVSESSDGLNAQLSLADDACNLYGTDIRRLSVSVEFQSKERLAVTIMPSEIHKPDNESYYLLPESVVGKGKKEQMQGGRDLELEYEKNPFSLTVKRKANGETLFSTKGSKLVYENQFLEIKTILPKNHNVYGLGETINNFKLSPGTVRTMHNADIPDKVDANLYGTHPFYVEQRYKDSKGSAHGVFLRNSHTQEVKIDDNSLTWRALGGAMEFYFFSGPTTKEVVRQYQEVIGRPAMQQYWTLGFHQSRYGMKTYEEFKNISEEYTKHNIPLETMWSDLDYMDQKRDFTLSPENYPKDKFNQVLENLHDDHRHYIPLVDAAINVVENGSYSTYSRGTNADVFVKNPDGSNFIGDVWPGPCVFPDWLAPNTSDWWQKELDEFHKLLPYDGIWLDMNEVSSFCTADGCDNYTESPNGPNGIYYNGEVANSSNPNARNLRFPPYVVDNAVDSVEIGGKTIPMESVHYDGTREYDWHNLWGYQISVNTYNALTKLFPNRRPFVLSRSTFPGSGSVSAHWGGDNYSKWEYLRYSISQGLSFSLFGIPMFGTDTCGFSGEPQEELCNRWSQLNAFFSFYRNHKSIGTGRQEFYLWDSVAEAAKSAMEIRYKLLPYMYTLLYYSHTRGDTWLRALSWEFTDDESLAEVIDQFMVGPSIMVVPVLDKGKTKVENAVFPSGSIWYDWYTNEKLTPGVKTVDAPLGHIPVYIRGGSVLALQQPGLTTHKSRQGNWELLIALDSDGKAEGKLYLDDGESINPTSSSEVKFEVSDGKLKIETKGTYQTTSLSKITVIGASNHSITKDVDNSGWLDSLQEINLN